MFNKLIKIKIFFYKHKNIVSFYLDFSFDDLHIHKQQIFLYRKKSCASSIDYETLSQHFRYTETKLHLLKR